MNGSKRLNGLYKCPECNIRHGYFIPTRDNTMIRQLEMACGINLFDSLNQNIDAPKVQLYIPRQIETRYEDMLNNDTTTPSERNL
jgi:hypothetical protein